MLKIKRETKDAVGPWRSVERVVRDNVLVYPVGAPIPREEAIRQGLIESEGEAPALADLLHPDVVEALEEWGVATLSELLSHSDEDILAVPGIGPATLKRLKEACKQGG